ncbi:MAG: HD domain-containing protein, partial [Pseudomonadota bacterium]
MTKLRVWLHGVSGRAVEHISFDMQTVLAEKCGFHDRPGIRGVERLMRQYFLTARIVQALCSHCILVAQAKIKTHIPTRNNDEYIDGFIRRGHILLLSKNDAQKPIRVLKFFKICLHENLMPDTQTLEFIKTRAFVGLVKKDPRAGRLFMDILCARQGQDRILRIMSECGVLGRLIPDFGRIVAQMQYNMYHVYTTDEHTIRAIGILSKIEQGAMQATYPVSTHAIHRIVSRRILYMAVFLHDIAKGQPGDHSIVGAEIAKKLCPLFGFDDDETYLIQWLVLHHLLMSNTAFRRDLDDTKTITDFVEKVKTPERLRLLICLTVADITSVGPNVWNNWKATLLRNLYHRSIAYLIG